MLWFVGQILQVRPAIELKNSLLVLIKPRTFAIVLGDSTSGHALIDHEPLALI